MKNKTAGVILLIAAGAVVVVCTAVAQIAASVVLAAFHLAELRGMNPQSPSEASPHWLVFVFVAILTGSGLYFLFSRDKSG